MLVMRIEVAFFFEKKNQKTSAPCGRWPGHGRQQEFYDFAASRGSNNAPGPD
jgi:hypothetical protein